jgi:hypothetical protein
MAAGATAQGRAPQTLGHLRIIIPHFLGRGIQGAVVTGSTDPRKAQSFFWAPAIGGGPRPPPPRPHRGARAAGALPRRPKHLPPPGVGLLIIETSITIPSRIAAAPEACSPIASLRPNASAQRSTGLLSSRSRRRPLGMPGPHFLAFLCETYKFSNNSVDKRLHGLTFCECSLRKE